MQNILNFIENNYLWFLVISLIIIFILIGYIVDVTKPKEKKNKQKIKTIDEVVPDKNPVHPSIEKYTDDQFDEPLIK